MDKNMSLVEFREKYKAIRVNTHKGLCEFKTKDLPDVLLVKLSACELGYKAFVFATFENQAKLLEFPYKVVI